jgi:hypothetical protein
MKSYSKALFINSFIFFACCVCSGSEQVTILKRNGGWCWYQDERALIHEGILIFGSVAHRSGFGGESRNGNIEITITDLENDPKPITVVLHEHLEADDHNAPALLFRNDGRLLAVYCKHNSDNLIRMRTAQPAGHFITWTDEKVIEREAKVTYANLCALSDQNGRIYDFYRGENWNPNFIFSDDGNDWQYGGRLIDFPGRPYVKYCSDGRSKIHFITTEHHPRDYINSIYHVFMQNGRLFKSDGTLIRDLSDGPMNPQDGTLIFQGDSSANAWTIDIELDSFGNPYIAYLVEEDNDPEKIVYRYARWNGASWRDRFLAHAGSALYPAEAHYSGLAALDPDDPNTVVISADVDPVTGMPLISREDGKRHYEIFRGTSADGSAWSWEPVTKDSKADQLRPVIPKSDGSFKAVLWLSGQYHSYTDFNLDVVGIISKAR